MPITFHIRSSIFCFLLTKWKYQNWSAFYLNWIELKLEVTASFASPSVITQIEGFIFSPFNLGWWQWHCRRVKQHIQTLSGHWWVFLKEILIQINENEWHHHFHSLHHATLDMWSSFFYQLKNVESENISNSWTENREKWHQVTNCFLFSFK